MGIRLSEFSYLLPSFLWYHKYNNDFDARAWFFFLVKEYLPLVAMSWYARGDILIGILIFYVYEIGYAFNDKTLINNKFIIISRILLTLLAFCMLSFLSIELGVGIMLLMLVFALHNFLKEKSVPRVFTWLILNVGKIYLSGGGTGVLLFAVLIIKRAGIYMRKKIDYNINPGFQVVTFTLLMIFTLYNFSIYFCVFFVMVNIYVMRNFWSNLVPSS